jgi:hypothetical protein
MLIIRSKIGRWIKMGSLLMGIAIAAWGFSGPSKDMVFIGQDISRPTTLTVAKEFVFHGEWGKACQALDLYVTSAGKDVDEALYWLALSLNKLAGNSDDSQVREDFRTNAMTRLDCLIRTFPGSLWLEEGQSLRLEIAAELVREGKVQYRDIIDTAVTTKGAGSPALLLAALSALSSLDAPAALPHIQRILEMEKDSGLRRKAMLILGRRYSRDAAEILRRTAKSDPDPEVRSDAVYWLANIRPSHLTFFFFSGKVNAAQKSFLLEGIPMFSLLPRTSGMDVAGLRSTLTHLYAGDYFAIKPIQGKSHFILSFFSMIQGSIWMLPVPLGDIQFRFEGDMVGMSPDKIGGRIVLKDILTRKEHPIDFQASEDADGLITVRKGGNVFFIVFRFDSGRDEVRR